MNNIPYIDILILAMVAIFIINRLRNTLGKKTGNEHDIVNKFTRGKSDLKESSPDKVTKSSIDQINLEESKHVFHENPGISSELSKIHKIDPSFKVDDFIVGAKKAFEYISREGENYFNDNNYNIIFGIFMLPNLPGGRARTTSSFIPAHFRT